MSVSSALATLTISETGNTADAIAQRVQSWCQTRGMGEVRLTRLAGLTNLVYLAESSSSNACCQRCVIRVADPQMPASLSPLRADFQQVLAYHEAAHALGLAPTVIGHDATLGLLAIEYVGAAKALTNQDLPAIERLMQTLISDDAQQAWRAIDQQSDNATSQTTASLDWSLLPALIAQFAVDQQAGDWQEAQQIRCRYASDLLELAASRQISQMRLYPSHSDLNPNNLLHDGQRWWLIDWDFAGWRPKTWDWAGLVIEHAWSPEQAHKQLARLELPHLDWFCACIGLINWDWHSRRGSDAQIVAASRRQTQRWLATLSSSSSEFSIRSKKSDAS